MTKDKKISLLVQSHNKLLLENASLKDEINELKQKMSPDQEIAQIMQDAVLLRDNWAKLVEELEKRKDEYDTLIAELREAREKAVKKDPFLKWMGKRFTK